MEQSRAEPATILETEEPMERRAPEVGIDETHPRATLRGHHPEVRHRGGFPLAWACGGEDDRSSRRIQPGELDVGSEHPVGLRGGRLRLGQRDENRRTPGGPLARVLGHYRLASNFGTIPMTGRPR